jgi:hypothetical protein
LVRTADTKHPPFQPLLTLARGVNRCSHKQRECGRPSRNTPRPEPGFWKVLVSWSVPLIPWETGQYQTSSVAYFASASGQRNGPSSGGKAEAAFCGTNAGRPGTILMWVCQPPSPINSALRVACFGQYRNGQLILSAYARPRAISQRRTPLLNEKKPRWPASGGVFH